MWRAGGRPRSTHPGRRSGLDHSHAATGARRDALVRPARSRKLRDHGRATSRRPFPAHHATRRCRFFPCAPSRAPQPLWAPRGSRGWAGEGPPPTPTGSAICRRTLARSRTPRRRAVETAVRREAPARHHLALAPRSPAQRDARARYYAECDDEQLQRVTAAALALVLVRPHRVGAARISISACASAACSPPQIFGGAAPTSRRSSTSSSRRLQHGGRRRRRGAPQSLLETAAG